MSHIQNMDNLCILCKKSFKGYGNNAEPIATGVCCDSCNLRVKTTRFPLRSYPHVLNNGTLVIRDELPSGNIEDSVVLSSKNFGFGFRPNPKLEHCVVDKMHKRD